jgi:hypothetical protein
MHQKRKSRQPPERVQQRAALPDELLMVCNDNPSFGRKFAEIFRDVKARGKRHE